MPPPPLRLALVIHALHGGGAERSVAHLANLWAERGLETALITLDATDTDCFALASSIQRIGLDLMQTSRNPCQSVRNNLHRIRRLGKAIRSCSPDLVLSFTDKMNVVTLLATRGTKIPTIICERTDPRYHSIGRIWDFLRARTYPRAAGLVVQTAAVQEYCRRIAPHLSIEVIPNFVLRPAQHRNPGEHQRIVAVGRLSAEKGMDRLLDAFARISPQHPQWSLTLVGEGEQRGVLQQQADTLGISDRVEFTGWVERPDEVLAASDLFVLPSRYEGFPNGLLEAMAIGLAVVAFDCHSGPREIITPEVDGLLIPEGDTEKLAAALSRLIKNPTLRAELGLNASKVLDRYGVEVILPRWETLFEELAGSQETAK